MPDWNVLGDNPEWNLVNGIVFSQDSIRDLGYGGNLWGESPMVANTSGEGPAFTPGGAVASNDLLQWLADNKYQILGRNVGNDLQTSLSQNGNLVGATSHYNTDDSGWFEQLVPMAISSVATGGLGSGLSGLFGGGLAGNVLGGGLAGGTMSSLQGGNFGKGFLGGAVSGGLKGLNIAGNVGITNPTLAKMFNRGAGGTLGALASGKSGSEALQSGVMGAGLAGANALGSQAMDFFGNAFKGLMPQTTGGDEFDALQGSGGDMTDQTDVSPNRYNEFVTGSDGMETFNPDYRFGGDQMMDSFSSPSQSIQSTGQPSFSAPPSLGALGSRVGNFALNNAGDLASMLYGFYNNRRQQRQLQQPMNNMSNQVNQATTQLQNMFTQNSPYAQQLRAKLNAQAAASGRRSNVAGRETQFQAMLAEKAASTLPQIANMQNSLMQNQLQMQQQQGRLKNSNMNDVLNFAKQSGLLGMAGQGLKNLFSNDNTYAGGGYNMTGVQNPYGSDVIFNGWGG